MTRPNGYTAAWTDEDVTYLRDNYGTLPVREIAAHLGRSVKAVYGQAALREGVLLREIRPYTAAEDAVIRKTYGLLSAPEIGQRIGRPSRSVVWRANGLGLRWQEIARSRAGAKLEELRALQVCEIAPALPPAPPPPLGAAPSTQIAAATVHGYFSSVTSIEQAYILGLLAADGCVASAHPRVIFGLKAEDAHLVEWVRDRLNPKANLSRATKTGFARIQVTSRQMVADLARYGIVPRKSRILAWPAHLGPLLPPFLLGYYDGDGSAFLIRDKYPGWNVCSGSRAFLEDMKEYIQVTTGVTLEKIHHRPSSDLWQVNTTSLGAFVLDQWLHQCGLGLARKRCPERALARYR